MMTHNEVAAEIVRQLGGEEFTNKYECKYSAVDIERGGLRIVTPRCGVMVVLTAMDLYEIRFYGKTEDGEVVPLAHIKDANCDNIRENFDTVIADLDKRFGVQ